MSKKPQMTMLQVQAAQSQVPTGRVPHGASEVYLWVSGWTWGRSWGGTVGCRLKPGTTSV